MSVDEKTLKDIEEIKKEIKKEFIEPIILFTENKQKNKLSPELYMQEYSKLQNIVNSGDNEAGLVYLFHNEVVKDYITKNFKLISSQPKEELIDLFIKQTENINYFMHRSFCLFCYLDRFYLKAKNRITLSKTEMNLYKEIYFNPIKDDIFKELCRLIKQDRNGNNETRNKIKSVMKILNDMDIKEPQITSEKKQGIWIPDKNNSEPYNHFTYFYQNEWFEKFFKDETIQFAKEKAEKEIAANSPFEFILSQLKYIEEEKERQREYINEKYNDSINKINYQFLLGNVEELIRMDNGIASMFENKKKDELKKAYELLKLYEPSLNILKEAFVSYIKNKCEEFKEKKEGKGGEEFTNF